VSADRDVTRIVRSWLEEGATALPDRVLDTVLDQLPATPQRRAPWPVRRLTLMHAPARFAAAAAAVAVVALIGVIAIPKGGGVGHSPPASSPTPSPSLTLAPTPSPIVLDPTKHVGVALNAGTYATGDPFSIPFSLTLPAGWVPSNITAGEVNLGEMGFFVALGAYPDPCHPEAGGGSPGPAPRTVDELVAGLTSMVDFDASAVSNVTIDGHQAKHFSITNAIDTSTAECTNRDLLPLFQEFDGVNASTNGGTTQQIWIVPAAPHPLTIIAEPNLGDPSHNQAAIDQVIASINFP
jgi:hypothetical protein